MKTQRLEVKSTYVPEKMARELDLEHVEVLRQSKKKGNPLPQPVFMPDGGLYRLLLGNHAFHALTADGETTVDARITDGPLQDGDILLMQVQENDVRKDFTVTERIRLYSGLMDAFGWTQGELAEQVGRSPSLVNKILNRGKKLHQAVFALLVEGKLADRAADAIAKLPLDQQAALATKVVAEGWKVEKTEKTVKVMLGKVAKRTRKQRVKTPGGLEAAFTCSMEELLDETVQLAKAARKAIRLGLGPESLPNLLSA
jgi:ParB family transcriptional regulator, chromosome partitioning protein